MLTSATQLRHFRFRVLHRLVICVALGALATVSLAWCGGVAFSSDRISNLGWNLLTSSPSDWAFGIRESWGRTEVLTYSTRGMDRTPRNEDLRPPSWSKLSGASKPPAILTQEWMAREIACGWPCRALYAVRIHLSDGVGTRLRGGFDLQLGSTRATMCVVPIPLGFAANTFIFAAVFAVPLTALPAFRRYLRARRSRCSSCNYNLRGLPSPTCPECGHASTFH